MNSALIIGGDGMIGSALAAHLQSQNVEVHTTNRSTLDLAQPEKWPTLPKADVAYLCAAITKLDACENDPQGTTKINVTHMQKLAEKLLAQESFVVFLSSNQVFDGSKPLVTAEDIPNPINQYGKQKAAFESWLLSQNKPAAVLRLTKVIDKPLPILAAWEEQLKAGKQIEAFDDLVFAPIPLAAVTTALIHIGNEKKSGIFQLSGTKDISYFQIARLLAKKINVNESLIAKLSATSKGIPTNFLPKYGSLETSPFSNIIIPSPEEIVI